MRAVLGACLLGGAIAVASSGTRAVRADDVATVSSQTLERLEEIARTYAKKGRVDQTARVAPELCSAPPSPGPRISEDHGGKKLYYLYANDRDSYLANEVSSGQWVVKESFPVADEGSRVAHGKKGLFIMLRLEWCRTPPDGSDEGWVYATADEKGKITNAGAISTCVRCHALAKNERLFGLDGKKPAKEEKK